MPRLRLRQTGAPVRAMSGALGSAAARRIAQALRGLAHGSIQLVVHDSQIVRIERVERVRLTVSTEACQQLGGQPTDSPEVDHARGTKE